MDLEPFLGEISIAAFNFPPKGWAFCNGQILPINQNQALFALLGTTFGGDGRTTFALPDLRGRAPVHAGSGISPNAGVSLGERGGQASVTLNSTQIPAHSHAMAATTALANSTDPNAKALAAKGRGGANVYAPAANLTPMAPAAVSTVGGSQAHENTQPSLALNFVIALRGVFPSRN